MGAADGGMEYLILESIYFGFISYFFEENAFKSFHCSIQYIHSRVLKTVSNACFS